MERFTEMFLQIDQTTSTKKKVQALVDYLREADSSDKLWTIALFTSRRPKRTISTTLLKYWASEMAGIPFWLFQESYHIVGDLAETIALVLPSPTETSNLSLTEWIHAINSQKDKTEEEKKKFILNSWSQLNTNQRFLFNKLITGGFRIGVSQKTITKAIAQYIDVDENTIAHRLMGDWHPDQTTFKELLIDEDQGDDLSKPYPFYLAYPLEGTVDSLEEPNEWFAEWKWDGIRGQIIKRNNNLYVWSRGQELVTDKFPELYNLMNVSEDNWVIDGEIIGMIDGKPLNFNKLQTRIGRKKVSKKQLIETPIAIIAYDLLEFNGEDIREQPLYKRRAQLEYLVSEINDPKILTLSPMVDYASWNELSELRAKSREMLAEGLMLKRKDSVYRSGRKKGDWWKWKIDPMNIDAVMLYAQRGHGRRANLYTDFTFAVWDGDALVPFAKAYSGLTDKEFSEVSKFVRKNTIERFGPVASVKPELVFELSFEGIAISKRHKSGIALRFPRIKRWRKDKPAKEANTLLDLKKLLDEY